MKPAKGDFIGRDSLVRQKEDGLKRKLVGFEMTGRGIARDHYPIWIDGVEVGRSEVRKSGAVSRKNIGMAYLPIESAIPGREFEVEIRGKRISAVVVATPFYKRAK